MSDERHGAVSGFGASSPFRVCIECAAALGSRTDVPERSPEDRRPLGGRGQW